MEALAESGKWVQKAESDEPEEKEESRDSSKEKQPDSGDNEVLDSPSGDALPSRAKSAKRITSIERKRRRTA
eukprot:4970648-Pleurochrysis_carterae.AAC.1